MKNAANFLVGTFSTLGLANAMDVGQVDPELGQMIEGLISLLGGTISAVIIAYLNRLWKKIDRKKFPDSK